MHAAALKTAVQSRYADFVADLEHLVGIDSGSWNVAGVNRVGQWSAARMTHLGFEVSRTNLSALGLGDSVVGRRRGADPAGNRILLMAHMDTVFDDGEAAVRPFRVDGSTARGPGVCDDKAGLLAGLYAVQALDDLGLDRYAEIVLHCSPDEEVGSPGSRQVIEALASTVDYALCLECARANGDLVGARKGIADLRVTVTGRAAHAGIEPEKGINAALEAAHQVVALQALNGRWPDVSVNVGVLRAGSRPNVVCPSASYEVDLRAATTASFQAALTAVEQVIGRPTVPGARSCLQHTADHAPWQAAPGPLRDAAVAVAADLGLAVSIAATGGAADANTTAALGIPTLDGLGPVGGNDHSPAEYLDLSTVVDRVALLAGLIARLG